MDAISYLKSHHREVESLFAKIEKLADGKGREKKAIFNEIARKLEHHTKIEEDHFYPPGRKVDEDLTLEAYEEHEVVKSLIRKIKKTSPGDETFMAKVTVLKEVVEHHVKEEEKDYFPECKKAFGDVKLEKLGQELEKEFNRLEGRSGVKSAKKAA